MAVVLVAAGLILVWGLAHLAPTRAVVRGFGQLTPDNARILTMEWVAEGLTLIFLGALPSLALQQLGIGHVGTVLVLRASAAMLMVLAVWSAVTGARTAVLPMRLCPVVKTGVAIAYLAASFSG